MSAATIEHHPRKQPLIGIRARRRPLAFDRARSLGTPSDERFDRIVRLARRVCDVPVARVILTAAEDHSSRRLRFRRDVELRVHGRHAGVLRVGDFVPRTLDGEQEEMLRELASLAEQQIRESAAQRALAKQNQQLWTRAFIDGLTSVWNRQAIGDIARREVEAARSHHQTVGLLLIDLDFFKGINDSHGHAAGDAVLREVSARLRASIRATDAVGRYGGEEFLVVMPESSLATAVAAGERIRQAIAQPIEVDGTRLTVTVSVGVAVHRSADHGLDHTIRAADAALYRAKASGRNAVAVAST
jgi:diguanylate cyclase (GGDEF)-like protein